MISEYIISTRDPILITGANGFIGAKVVETLLRYGFTNLRCFVRPSSRLERLKESVNRFSAGGSARLVVGDLLSAEDCRKAADGVSVIYHLAAGIEKSFAAAFANSVLATRNLLDAFVELGRLKRFVNVSSFAVYSTLTLKKGDLLDETCPLEDSPQERCDAYCFGKLKQEEIVKEYGTRHNLPHVIVRPGAVFGPGKRTLSGRVGINTFGFFIHLGGANRLPLTFVDNCAEAVVLAGLRADVDGEIFNVVDDDSLTSSEFLEAYKQRVDPFFSVRFPYALAYGASLAWEKYSQWSQGQLPPVFNRRRCSSEWKGNRFSNNKLKQRLGWKPKIGMKEAMDSFLGQFEPQGGGAD